jgi:hypothetical protein
MRKDIYYFIRPPLRLKFCMVTQRYIKMGPINIDLESSLNHATALAENTAESEPSNGTGEFLIRYSSSSFNELYHIGSSPAAAVCPYICIHAYTYRTIRREIVKARTRRLERSAKIKTRWKML